MKEGYWINYSTNKIFQVEEHEDWIRDLKNAKKIKLPKSLINTFDEYEPKKDRNEFIMNIMEKSSLMRMRGHGTYFTFEFSNKRIKRPIDAIWDFCMSNAGPYTGLLIVNLSTKQQSQMTYKTFLDYMEQGRDDQILRESSFDKLFKKITKLKYKEDIFESMTKYFPASKVSKLKYKEDKDDIGDIKDIFESILN